jgi:hypothetical protein
MTDLPDRPADSREQVLPGGGLAHSGCPFGRNTTAEHEHDYEHDYEHAYEYELEHEHEHEHDFGESAPRMVATNDAIS